MSTTTITVDARLTCNHTIQVPLAHDDEIRVGDKVQCEKCPAAKSGAARTRRVKNLHASHSPAPEAPAPEPTIGRDFSPTDLNHPLIARLGHTVDYMGDEGPGTATLANVTEDGMATLTDGDIVVAVVPTDAVMDAPTIQDVGDVAVPDTAPADRLTRYMDARNEWADLKAWKAAGSVGDRPATPTLDAQNIANAGGQGPRKVAAPDDAPKAKRAPSTPEAPKAPRKVTTPGLRFFHDDQPMPDSQNKLSSVAWYYTRGCDTTDQARRISTGELKAILSDAGITDPTTTEWEHTLPNGTTLAAKVIATD